MLLKSLFFFCILHFIQQYNIKAKEEGGNPDIAKT